MELIHIIDVYLSKILESPVFGSLMGLISLVYAYYLYKKSSPRKSQFNYVIKSDNIFSSEAIDLDDISFNIGNIGNQRHLSISYIYCYNEGQQTIRKEDITVTDPLFITLSKDLKIFSLEIVKTKTISNNIRLTKHADNQFQILFDYLSPDDFFIIKVATDSKLLEDYIFEQINISGTIIDSAGIHKCYYSRGYKSTSSADITSVTPIISAIPIVLYAYFIYVFSNTFNFQYPVWLLAIGAFLIFTYTYITISKTQHKEYNTVRSALLSLRKN